MRRSVRGDVMDEKKRDTMDDLTGSIGRAIGGFQCMNVECMLGDLQVMSDRRVDNMGYRVMGKDRSPNTNPTSKVAASPISSTASSVCDYMVMSTHE